MLSLARNATLTAVPASLCPKCTGTTIKLAIGNFATHTLQKGN